MNTKRIANPNSLKRFSEQDSPSFELQLGCLTVSGTDPLPVLRFLTQCYQACRMKLEVTDSKPVVVLQDSNHTSKVSLLPEHKATLVLNLNNVEIARFSEETAGTIRWYCDRDPHVVAGRLLDQYQGAYFNRDNSEIVYTTDSEMKRFKLKSFSDYQEWMPAAVCAAMEMSVPESVIREALIQHKDTTPADQTNYPFNNFKGSLSPSVSNANSQGA